MASNTNDNSLIADISTKLHEASMIDLITVIGSLFVIIVGLLIVWQRLKDKEQGFGDNSLKAMGLTIFFPTLIILSVVVDKFQTETLAALLGTLAGYIFSKPESSSNNPPPPRQNDKENNN